MPQRSTEGTLSECSMALDNLEFLKGPLTAPASLPIPKSIGSMVATVLGSKRKGKVSPRSRDGYWQGLGDLQELPDGLKRERTTIPPLLKSAWSHVRKDMNVATDNPLHLSRVQSLLLQRNDTHSHSTISFMEFARPGLRLGMRTAT